MLGVENVLDIGTVEIKTDCILLQCDIPENAILLDVQGYDLSTWLIFI